MLRPVRVTPPAVSPVTLAEAKAHMRVSHTDDDVLIGTLLQAAVDHVDGWSGVLGRCLVTQGWSVSFGAWGGRVLRLPFSDVSAATVTYRDSDDAEQTVDPALYAIKEDDQSAYLFLSADFDRPALFDRPDAVTVTFTTGYGDADAVPRAIKHALYILIAHWYEHREAVVIGASPVAVPMTVDALLAPYRRVPI
jgi:uncharacterized phiE125 gp8 family phage protein